MGHELSAIAALAYREVADFLRDRPRLILTFSLPVVFIGLLGASLESNLGASVGYSFMTFAFTGILGQIMFQNTALGVISLNEERGKDVIQEAFVAPISRYTILTGKIAGESIVSLIQGAGVLVIGSLMNIEMTSAQVLALIPAGIAVAFLGGAFGVLVLTLVPSSRGAQQLFPIVIIPQIFLAGVFAPIKDLPFHIMIPSRMAPMTYAVDLVRSVFYRGLPEYPHVVLFGMIPDLIVAACMAAFFLAIGTFLFVRNERNR